MRLFGIRDRELDRIRAVTSEQEADLQTWMDENSELLREEQDAVINLGELATRLLRPHGTVFMREISDDETCTALYNWRSSGLGGLVVQQQALHYPLGYQKYAIRTHSVHVDPHHYLDKFSTALGYHATVKVAAGIGAGGIERDTNPSQILEVVQTAFAPLLEA